MRRLLALPLLLAALAACGDDSPSPPGKAKDLGIVRDTKAFRAGLEIKNLETEILQYQTLRGAWPSEITEVRRSALDPWGNLYKFDVEDGRPVVFSAGPDGEPGTDDDVFAAE